MLMILAKDLVSVKLEPNSTQMTLTKERTPCQSTCKKLKVSRNKMSQVETEHSSGGNPRVRPHRFHQLRICMVQFRSFYRPIDGRIPLLVLISIGSLDQNGSPLVFEYNIPEDLGSEQPLTLPDPETELPQECWSDGGDHSDQGSKFESRLMKEFCQLQLWGCYKTRTAPDRSHANEICEILNRTIAYALQSLLTDHQCKSKDWDHLQLVIPQIMHILRAVPHTVTKEILNYLMLEREVR